MRSWDNKIILVELLQPNKSDALSYLDNGAAAPDRYARAELKFGATEEPYLQEYVVGPLPVPNGPAYTIPGSNGTLNSSVPAPDGTAGGAGPMKRSLNDTTGSATKLEELNYIYNKGKGYQRVYDQDKVAIAAFTYQISASIQDLTLQLFNGVSLSPTSFVVV